MSMSICSSVGRPASTIAAPRTLTAIFTRCPAFDSGSYRLITESWQRVGRNTPHPARSRVLWAGNYSPTVFPQLTSTCLTHSAAPSATKRGGIPYEVYLALTPDHYLHKVPMDLGRPTIGAVRVLVSYENRRALLGKMYVSCSTPWYELMRRRCTERSPQRRSRMRTRVLERVTHPPPCFLSHAPPSVPARPPCRCRRNSHGLGADRTTGWVIPPHWPSGAR
ncbi:hypothetical protein C8Q77DRAFT_177292 [Trametes polyzona]|nr:hypothetical protein C8Q77DRAFT_177292 [Trametes polyzona]